MEKEWSRGEINAAIEYNRGVLAEAENKIAEWMVISTEAAARIKYLSSLTTKQESIEAAKEDIRNVFKDVYSQHWTLVKKTEFVLRNMTRRISTTREIAEAIKSREEVIPMSSDETHPITIKDSPIIHIIDLADLISRLGATLKQKVDKGDLLGRFEIEGTWYYGMLDWFDEKGVVKFEYMR